MKWRYKTRIYLFLLLLIAPLWLISSARGQERTPGDEQRLQAVIQFADYALEKGRDRYQGVRGQPWWRGEEVTPLFVDGLEIETGLPVIWVQNGRHHVISNLAHQQNFFRTLDGLSNLTGDERYRKAAIDATNYMFDNYRSSCGLLYWGGHTFVDLRTLEVVDTEGPHMEIKMHLPYYNLMWQADSLATLQFIRAFWNSNVREWERLVINRHAPFGVEMGSLWDSRWDDPEPLYVTEFSGSVMPITDMTYSAAWISKYSDEDKKALIWARRFADLMNRARHPETLLGPTRPTVMQPGSRRGSGWRQDEFFREEFGPVSKQAWMLWGQSTRRVYVEFVLSQLAIAEMLNPDGEIFLTFPVEGLKAYYNHAYDRNRNVFRAMWADGTDMTGYVIRQPDDPPDAAGDTLKAYPADFSFLLAYARAWRQSGDPELWYAARQLALAGGIGNIGERPGQSVNISLDTGISDPLALLAMLELYRGSENADYLELSRRIGDNIVDQRFRNHFFIESERHRFARFDAIEPLALLSLEAAIRGEFDQVPSFIGGKWRYLQGNFDGHGRAKDYDLYYAPDAYFLKRNITQSR